MNFYLQMLIIEAMLIIPTIQDDTEALLKKVHIKLKMVERDRYIMQQMARIENCHCGMDLQELEHIQWYHYSGFPKNTLNLILNIAIVLTMNFCSKFGY